jgi:hypothetical protein
MGLGMNLAWQHPDEGPSEGNAEPVVPDLCSPKRNDEIGGWPSHGGHVACHLYGLTAWEKLHIGGGGNQA